jgi:large subunit ribosomal protein L6e
MAKQPTTRISKWYKADDEAVHFSRSRVSKQNKQTMRKSIQAGSILIILSGKYRGKRVVCLKAFSSGLLLVTGPFRFNGVPLKRVNQAFVMSTSSKVDLSGVDVSKVDETFFNKEKALK